MFGETTAGSAARGRRPHPEGLAVGRGDARQCRYPSDGSPLILASILADDLLSRDHRCCRLVRSQRAAWYVKPTDNLWLLGSAILGVFFFAGFSVYLRSVDCKLNSGR